MKHTKSNTIVLANNRQLVASGVGQTSRVDALKQAIQKANSFGFDLNGSVMASDAFFPFSDSVQIAHEAGVSAVIQPGGSIRDKDSIEYCNENNMSMVFTNCTEGERSRLTGGDIAYNQVCCERFFNAPHESIF